jgi:hypothetical protein
MPAADPLSKLEMLRLDSWAVAVAETLLGTGHPVVTEGDEWRVGSGLSLSRAKPGRWYSHIDRTGGEHTYDLIRFLKKFTRASEVQEWARIWLQSHQGFGQPITAADEEGAEDEEASRREERLAEFVAEAGELGEQGTAYFHKRGLDAAKAEAAGAQWIRPNVVRVADAARVAPLYYRGRQIGLELKMLDAATLGRSPVMPPRYRYQTETPVRGEPVTFAYLPTPVSIANLYPGPVLCCEGFEDFLSLQLAYPDRLVIGVPGSLANLGNIPLPRGHRVIVCGDGDVPDSPAAKAKQKGIDGLLAHGLTVSVTTPPTGKDNNDTIVEHGIEGLRALVDAAVPATMSLRGAAQHLTTMDRADAMQARKVIARTHGVTKKDVEILEAEARRHPAEERHAEVDPKAAPRWDDTIDLDAALHAGLAVLERYIVAPRGLSRLLGWSRGQVPEGPPAVQAFQLWLGRRQAQKTFRPPMSGHTQCNCCGETCPRDKHTLQQPARTGAPKEGRRIEQDAAGGACAENTRADG